MIVSTTILQIVKFFKNCFSFEFDCKKPGRTKSKTPTINMTESNLSIKKLLYNFCFGAVGETRTLMD